MTHFRIFLYQELHFWTVQKNGSEDEILIIIIYHCKDKAIYIEIDG